jgi:hypothetical protein
MNLSSIQKSRALSIGFTTLSLLCCIPQGPCYANDLESEMILIKKIQETRSTDPEMLTKNLIESAQSIANQEGDLLAGTRQFLKDLTHQINTQCSQRLSLSDMCRLIRENANLFQIPVEEQPALLVALALIESETETFQSVIDTLPIACILPFYPDAYLTVWDWVLHYRERKQEKKERRKKELELKKMLQCLPAISQELKTVLIVTLAVGLGIAAMYFCPGATSEIIEIVIGAILKIAIA